MLAWAAPLPPFAPSRSSLAADEAFGFRYRSKSSCLSRKVRRLPFQAPPAGGAVSICPEQFVLRGSVEFSLDPERTLPPPNHEGCCGTPAQTVFFERLKGGR